jgi:hypothetical protein
MMPGDKGLRMEELVGRIFEVKKYLVGFVVEWCCIIEHTCARTEMGLGGLNRGQKDLMGVWVQQVGG